MSQKSSVIADKTFVGERRLRSGDLHVTDAKFDQVAGRIKRFDELQKEIFDVPPVTDVVPVVEICADSGWTFDVPAGVEYKTIFSEGLVSVTDARVIPPGIPERQHEGREWILFLKGDGFIKIGRTLYPISHGVMYPVMTFQKHAVIPHGRNVIHMLSFQCFDEKGGQGSCV